MNNGRVYLWEPAQTGARAGTVCTAVVPLPRLDADGRGRLWGRYVRVRNAGWVNVCDAATGEIRSLPIGDARPNE